ncbi:hypothetical protein HY993_01985 [Candidatus Micrarchaeota archaeon]|nr:hypothetical protein [Candidatus Micrarchaeota archaeon]
MMLDSFAFEPKLTPESALSTVQSMLKKRGWKKYEVEDVKLEFVPYWFFSFDILAGENSPSGKAAINASEGDLDDFVPYLLSRPLKKTKSVSEGEVLPSNISRTEINDVAKAKLAAKVGAKKDDVSISAAVKYYVPFFRVWFSNPATGDGFDVKIDACLGSPQGFDQVPGLEKQPSSLPAVLSKLTSPATFSQGLSEVISGKNKMMVWVLLGAVIVVLLYFVGFQPTASADCSVSPQFLGEREYAFFGRQFVKPRADDKGGLFIQGSCSVKAKDATPVCYSLRLMKDGRAAAQSSACSAFTPQGQSSSSSFNFSWQGSSKQKYSFEYDCINCK